MPTSLKGNFGPLVIFDTTTLSFTRKEGTIDSDGMTYSWKMKI